MCGRITLEDSIRNSTLVVYAHLFGDDCNATIYEQSKTVRVYWLCWDTEGCFRSPRGPSPDGHAFRPPQLCAEEWLWNERIKCIWCNGENISLDDSVTGTAIYTMQDSPRRTIIHENEVCIQCVYDSFNAAKYDHHEGPGA